MTQEQITKAAEEYASKYWVKGGFNSEWPGYVGAYIAGAESRQSKIDQLQELLKKAVYTASVRLQWTSELAVVHQLEDANYKNSQEIEKWKNMARKLYHELDSYLQAVDPVQDTIDVMEEYETMIIGI